MKTITVKYFVTTTGVLQVVVANNFLLIILEYPDRRLFSLVISTVFSKSKNYGRRPETGRKHSWEWRLSLVIFT